VAEMAVKLAQSGASPVEELRWAEFLAGAESTGRPAPNKAKG